MPITVEVEGIGRLEFPEGMSQTDMAKAIRTGFPKQVRAQLEKAQAETAGDRASVVGQVTPGDAYQAFLDSGVNPANWPGIVSSNVRRVEHAIDPNAPPVEETAAALAQPAADYFGNLLNYGEKGKGALQGGIETAAGLVLGAPEFIPAIAAGAVAGPASAMPMGAAFSADMLTGAYEARKAAKEAEAQGDTREAARLNAQALLSAGMGASIPLGHAAMEAIPKAREILSGKSEKPAAPGGREQAAPGEKPPVMEPQAEPATADEVLNLVSASKNPQDLADIAQAGSVVRGFNEQWSAAEQEAVTMAILKKRNELALAQAEEQPAPTAEPQPKTPEVKDAAQARQITEGDQQQHPPGDVVGPTTEAGGGNRLVEGGQVTEVQPEPKVEAPKPPLTAPEKEAVRSAETTPAPEQERKPFNPTEARAQKKYLLSEIDQAIKEAGADIPEQGVRFDKYRTESAIQQNAEIHKRNLERFGTVTIDVPGDGTFTVLNTKQSLRELKNRAAGFPTTVPKQSGPPSARTTPSSVPSVGKLNDATALKTAADQVSSDKFRLTINKVYADSEVTVASDGRRMIVIKHGLKQGSKGPTMLEQSGAVFDAAGDRYPDWKQVIPKKTTTIAKDIDNGRLFTILKQAEAAVKDAEYPKAMLQVNQDGSIGVSTFVDKPKDAEHFSQASYAHNAHPNPKFQAAYSIKYLLDSMRAMRALGDEKFNLAVASEKNPELGPVMLKSKAADQIIMPFRLEEGDVGFAAGIEKVRKSAPPPEPSSQPKRRSPKGAEAYSESAYPGGPLGKGPAAPADNPGFTVFHVDLPEAVHFIHTLLGGSFPRVREKIRALRGSAMGVFRHNDATGKAEIDIRHDLFGLDEGVMTELRKKAEAFAKAESDIPKERERIYRDKLDELVLDESKRTAPLLALKTIWHEIGHLVDWLPQKMLTRGNLFGHIAALKTYLKHWLPMEPGGTGKPLNAFEKKQLFSEARKQVQREIGEIVETIQVEEPVFADVPVTPDMIRQMFGMSAREQYPDLYTWFAGQTAAVKKEIVRKAMKEIVDDRVAHQAGRQKVGTRTVTKEIRKPGRKPTQEEIKTRFRELLVKAMKERRIADLEMLTSELEPLIAWWRGTEKMEDYFKPATEMFAEAFSVFMNNPAAVAQRAPTYFEMMHHYLDSRPEVRALYGKIQDSIRAGTVMRDRVLRLRDSWAADDKASMKRANDRYNKVGEDLLDNVIYHYDRQFGPMYRVASRGPNAGRVSRVIGDFLYRASEHELFLGRMNRTVSMPLLKANLDWNDLGEYMFHKHVTESRYVRNEKHELRAIANPGGWEAKQSTKRLREMQTSTYTPEQFRVLEAAQRQFRKLYEEHVVQPMRASKMASPELMKAIEDRVFYATFAKSKGYEDLTGIDALLDSQLGTGVGGRIYRQFGHLGDIKQPATATTLKALSLISSIARNDVKREAIDLLRSDSPEMMREADRAWSGKRLAPVHVETQDVGTVYVMNEGKVSAYYVPKMWADMLNGGNTIENKVVLGFLKATRGIKNVFTQLNYGFWPVAAARDSLAWIAQMPGAGPWSLAREAIPSILAAARSINHTKENADAEAVLKRRMAISRADPQGLQSTVGNEYDLKLASFGLNPTAWNKEHKAFTRWLDRSWNAYRELGQIFERSFKIAGMRYLDRRYPNMPEWQKREIVRERAGSPDFLQRGVSSNVADLLMFFFNPWKEGVRSLAKAAKQNPISFTAKTVAFVNLPTVAMAMAVSGAIGDEIKKMFRSVPDYDMTNYLVVPLGWADKQQKTVAYLRFPLWEPARIMHGLLFKALTGRGQGYGSYLGGQVPGMNPLIDITRAWMTYEIAGKNPYDYPRGRQIISDTAYEAGPAYARPELRRWTWNAIGGGLFAKKTPDLIDQPDPKAVEKFLRLPVISNVLGRWIKVSNAGLRDAATSLEQPILQEQAQMRGAVLKMIVKLERDEKLTDAERVILNDPYALGYLMEKLPKALRSKASPLLRLLDNAKTKKGKQAILASPELTEPVE